MPWEDIRLWGLYAVFGAQLVFQFVGWLARRNLATPEQLDAVKELVRIERGRIHALQHDHNMLDQRVAQMPGHDDIGKLRDTVAQLDKTTGQLSEQVKALDRTSGTIEKSVDRIEQHLLDMKRDQ